MNQFKLEAEYEKLDKKLTAYIAAGGDENGLLAERMADRLAALDDLIAGCELGYGVDFDEYFDSERNGYPTPSDADSGL